MIRLDTTTRKLQVLLGGSVTTNQLPCCASYSDKTSAAYSGGTNALNTNNATAVDLVAAPSSGAVRDIDHVTIRNSDTVAQTVTTRLNDNGTTYILWSGNVNVGDTLEYTHAGGWRTTQAPFGFNLSQWNGVVPTAAVLLSDALANPTAPLIGAGALIWDRYNGQWVRQTINDMPRILASAARTAGVSTSVQPNRGYQGVFVIVNVTVLGAATTLTPHIIAIDGTSSVTRELITITGIAATGTYGYMVFPGAPAASSQVTAVSGFPLTPAWYFQMDQSTALSCTYSVDALYLV